MNMMDGNFNEEDPLETRMHRIGMLSASLVAATALTIGLAVPANAATSRSIGSVTCRYGPEIHTKSKAKGTVVHEIYGAFQTIQAWPVTNRVSPGYSSSYANWNQHHKWFIRNQSGGRVMGTGGVLSGEIKCQ
jgi:hypothetical protein